MTNQFMPFKTFNFVKLSWKALDLLQESRVVNSSFIVLNDTLAPEWTMNNKISPRSDQKCGTMK